MSAIWSDTDNNEEEPETPPDPLRLPPEIVISIASILPAQSAASLALCCRQLGQILGPKSWKSLRRAPHDDRFEFLSTLAKDIPQFLPCRSCLRLHHISAIKWPREISYSQSPPCISGGLQTTYQHLRGSFYEIHYPQIQLAMKQHRYGIDVGFPLEAFQYLEVWQGEGSPWKVVLSSANAQIVSDEFLMRFQFWTLVPWNRSDTFVEELEKDNHLYDVCSHDRIAGRRVESTATTLMMSRVRQLEEGEENCQSRTFQCSYCYMEHMVDAKDFGERGLAVITTKWVNLGAGRETPDAKWKSHWDIYSDRDRREINQTDEHRRSLREDFENQAEVSLEDLTADDEKKLFSTRKPQVVTRAPDGCVWRWRYGTRWYLDPSGTTGSAWEYWL